jgi:hypothetical protein
MRDPEWFLAKIAAGLEAAGVSPEATPAARKMSRPEIEAVVSETLRDELARLADPEPAPSESQTGETGEQAS